MCDVIFLLVGVDGEAAACIQGEVETACIYCKSRDKLFCPREDYTGNPNNPNITQPSRFEVRFTECHGA